MIRAAEFVNSLDHCAGMVRFYARVYAVTKVEHMAIAFPVAGQNPGDLFAYMFR
jgi:hypothetical protein